MPKVSVDFEGNTAGFDSATVRIAKQLNKWEAGVKATAKSVNSAFSLIGAGVSVAGIGALIKKNIDLADNLRDLSKSTGIMVKDLAGLDLAARQSGTNLEAVANAVNKLSVNIGKDSEKFRALGITATEPLEALAQLADVFNGIEDPQKRAAVAAAALGKSWAETAPLLSEGGAAIRKMVADGQRLSPITDEMAEAADKFNDEMEVMKTRLSSVGISLAGPVLTGLNQLIEKMQNATKTGVNFNNVMQGLIDVSIGADNSELGKVNSQIEFLEKKIQAIKSNGPIGALIDDVVGQDINLERNRLDALYKQREQLIEQQKRAAQVASDAGKAFKPPPGAVDTFIAGGEGKGKGGGKDKELIFSPEQLAKSEEIIRRLRNELQLTREQAAGVVGNLFHESAGFNTKAISGDGHNSLGLAQWTAGRRKELEQFAKDNGTLATDFNTQVSFLIKELTTSPREKIALARLRQTSGLEDATKVFQDEFERPKKELAHTDRRNAATKTAFLGGLTESEIKAQDGVFKSQAEQAQKVKDILDSINNDIASSKLPDLQRQITEETRSALQSAGLDLDTLTAAQQREKAAIEDAVKEKYFNLEVMKLEEDQRKNLKEQYDLKDAILAENAAMADGTVTREQYVKQLGDLADLYAKFQSGDKALGISAEQFNKLAGDITESFNLATKTVETETDKMSEYAEQASRNMQDAFANFLFDPFKGGLQGMADNFADTLRQMAANYLSSEIFDFFKSKSAGGKGSAIEGIANIVGDIFKGIATYDTGTPMVPKTGLAIIHKNEAVVPASYNRRGESPWHGGGGVVNLTQHITVGNGADRDMVKRAAGQGAREALSVMGSANRYR